MRAASLALLAALTLGACATNPGNPELARGVVLKYVGEGVGTVGPFNRRDRTELGSLTPEDRAKAIALLDQGALGFIVFGPDTGAAPRAAGGKLADLVNVARIVFVRDDKIVGDFAAAR